MLTATLWKKYWITPCIFCIPNFPFGAGHLNGPLAVFRLYQLLTSILRNKHTNYSDLKCFLSLEHHFISFATFGCCTCMLQMK